MKMLKPVVPVLLLCALLALPRLGKAQTDKTLQIKVSDSVIDEQSAEVPGRFVYLPGTGAVARGAETVRWYVVQTNAVVVGSGVKMSLTCDIREKGMRSIAPHSNPAPTQRNARATTSLLSMPGKTRSMWGI